jgi:hypothetical protein
MSRTAPGHREEDAQPGMGAVEAAEQGIGGGEGLLAVARGQVPRQQAPPAHRSLLVALPPYRHDLQLVIAGFGGERVA